MMPEKSEECKFVNLGTFYRSGSMVNREPDNFKPDAPKGRWEVVLAWFKRVWAAPSLFALQPLFLVLSHHLVINNWAGET
jgi:hypothetical protein